MAKLFNKFEEICSRENGIKNFIETLRNPNNLIKAFYFIHKYDGCHATSKIRDTVKYSIYFKPFERALCDTILQTLDLDDETKAKFIINNLVYLVHENMSNYSIYTVRELKQIIDNINNEYFDDTNIFNYLYHRKDDVVEINNTLINKMNNINYADAVGRTLLMLYVSNYNIKESDIAAINLLIGLGANINHCNIFNNSVLSKAIKYRNIDVINILINNNVVIDNMSRKKIIKSNKKIKKLFE